MAIRLQDIADDLNLSKMTISKVLRGQTDVSAETKARVLKRMEELKYRPNISARGLRTGQTFTIGFAIPSLEEPGLARMVAGVNECVRPGGYSVVITSTDGDADLHEGDVELHLARQVDALLICLRSDAFDFPQVLAVTKTPVALLGHAPSRFGGISVGVREAEVGQIAARHLLERGCKRIAYLRGPRTPVADLRFSGFLDEIRKAGLPVRPEWIVEAYPGDVGYRSGVEAMERLIAGRVRPDGVIACSDQQAMGGRDTALAAGMEVPRQLKIIGCGNSSEHCETGLGLTSVDLPYREIGKRAARMVLRAIEEKGSSPAQRAVLLSPKIVPRESTANVKQSERKGGR